jgi:hypothetical protein
MPTSKAAIDRFQKAVQAENALWAQLGDKLPGQAGYSSRQWAEWLEAVARTTSAAKDMRKAFKRENDAISGS